MSVVIKYVMILINFTAVMSFGLDDLVTGSWKERENKIFESGCEREEFKRKTRCRVPLFSNV